MGIIWRKKTMYFSLFLTPEMRTNSQLNMNIRNICVRSLTKHSSWIRFFLDMVFFRLYFALSSLAIKLALSLSFAPFQYKFKSIYVLTHTHTLTNLYTAFLLLWTVCLFFLLLSSPLLYAAHKLYYCIIKIILDCWPLL